MTILIFTLFLISGTRGFDVIGYSGGTVIIYCNHQVYGEYTKYFCKENNTPNTLKECFFIKPNQAQTTWIYKDRIFLHDFPGTLTVIYRALSLQDAGIYQCGGSGVWNYDMILKINTDPCCVSPKTVIGFLGGVIISCQYPEEFKDSYKYFFKLNGQQFIQVISTTEPQKDRFTISDDKSSKVVSVRISDVREDDGGVYFCGAGIGGKSVNYYSILPEIQLQVSAFRTTYKLQPTSTVPTSVTSGENFSSSIIITVCVCVALLLIGGSALIYKLRCKKTQDPAYVNKRSERTGTADTDYENDPPGNQNSMSMGLVYSNVEFDTNQSHSSYQHLDPQSREPDLVYHSLNPNAS
ncbi:CMRF35-like molecule 8 [Colossoma macropomum]|uniref:CMRF35-like molecule 8 n=1 Tax=Colossoma macropomum TaxID=42526 RepID=UPI001864C268|nr:CMRF35-like molecule 8 [Colossoma macropomum]